MQGNDFLIIAHRGASGMVAENTLASYQKALECGAGMIECDIHKTADGQLVVIHDANIDRTTNGAGLVKDLTLKELQNFKTKNGELIPTLVQAVEHIDRRVPLNIELKEEDLEEDLVALIAEFIKRGWSYKDFLVSSFNHPQLQKIKELDSHVPLGMLMGCIPLDYAACGQRLGAYAIHAWKDNLTQKYIDDIHARGLKIFVFTVNDKKEIEKLQKMGIDGVFTDYP